MRGTKMGKGCGRFLALLVLFSVVLSAGVLADPLDRWYRRDPPPQANWLIDVVYGNNVFVAVGRHKVILTSSDGVAWVDKIPGGTTPSADHFYFSRVAYGDSTFVAVGTEILNNGRVGMIFTSSDDGMSWLDRPSGVNTWLMGVTCGDSTFVVVGGDGTILTSTDKGATWETSSSGVTGHILGVAYGNNTFVAVGNDGMILTSSDGKLWGSSASGTNNHLESVAYCNNTFVAVGEAGTVLTSSDGVDWESESSGTSRELMGITYGNDTFVAVGDGCTILTSANGGTWEKRLSDPFSCVLLYAVAYGNNTFVVVGGAGGSGIIFQSDPVVFPIISVSPTTLNFDSVNVGSSSSKEVTITNTGSADLAVEAWIRITNMLDFDIKRPWKMTIAPLASHTMNVVFSPKSVGSGVASLSISSNDPYNPTVTVSLSGCGLPDPNNQPPTVGLGASPVSGPEPLKVEFTANAYDTDGVVVKYEWNFGGCMMPLTGGSSVNRTYYYGADGVYEAKVKVTDNDDATTESQSIKINVFRPDLVVDSISYDEKKKRLSVNIRNIGKADVLCGAVRINIYVNGVFNGYAAVYKAEIASDQTKTITKSRTPYGRFGVIIDPWNMIKEMNETNNTFGEVPKSK